MGISQIKEMIDCELEQEKKVLNHMIRRLKELPPGYLEVRIINGRYYYYQRAQENGERQTVYLDPYIDSHREIIRELKEKKTITHGLPVLKMNIGELEKCLPNAKPYHPADYQYGDSLGEKYYLDEDVCIRDWMKTSGNRNIAFAGGLIHGTKSGIRVRSKSEVLIADGLHDCGLLFKSEAELKLGERVFYPDFEFIHPETFRVMWWEHLGRLDDPEYVRKNMEKLEIYAQYRIRLGDNLIITGETENHPLTKDAIDKKMRHYGLK